MQIVFDFSFFNGLGDLPPYLIMWKIFISGGWGLLVVMMIQVLYMNWLSDKRREFLKNVEYALLAIDVPKDNEQGPKAVEHIFSLLSAAESGPKKLKEYYIEGKMKVPISLEVVSIEGYIQFLIRVPIDYRDLIEAAIYSQYPSVEITEVEDYATSIPTEFPSEEYDLWGAELVLQKESPYPIKTSVNFEDQTVKDNKFKDPMAAILEVLGKIGHSENIWLQILIVPTGDDWKKEGEKLVKKLLGMSGSKKNILDKALDLPLRFLYWIHINIWGPGSGLSERKDDLKQVTSGERKIVEAIEEKISKLGFETKFRIVYWADKNVFFKGRGVAATIGAIKQFSTLHLNGFVPDKKAKTGSKKPKKLVKEQMKFAKFFKDRTFDRGARPYILNTEELATVFHFPMINIKAPLLQRAEMKSAEAPATLPINFTDDIPMPVIKEVGFYNEDKNDEIPEELREIIHEDNSRDQTLDNPSSEIETKNKSTKSDNNFSSPPDNLPIA
ncbi:MAG: hypothetical protein WCX88_00490 [Patescibacteria group bacterium]